MSSSAQSRPALARDTFHFAAVKRLTSFFSIAYHAMTVV